jgi:hypothetical protein
MKQTTVRLVGVTLAGLALSGGFVVRAGADDLGRFSVSARSDVASAEYVDPQAPVVPGGQVLFATPASAQAVLDSLGASQAFAGAPYPGDFAVNFPNTVNGLANAGLPDYPFYVSSAYPAAPEAQRRVGINALSARSGPDSSVGEAQTGLITGNPSVASAVGRARATRQADAVLAEATSSVDGFAIGTTLRLGRISTLARLTVRPGSPPVKETAVSVASVTIAGQTVGLTEKGLVVTDEAVAPPLDVSALNQVLARAGIELRYVPAVETPSSITSASLRITWTTDVPGRGPVRTTLTLGQVRVSAEAEPAPGLDLPPVTSSAGATDTAPQPPSATDPAPAATGTTAAAVAAGPTAAPAPEPAAHPDAEAAINPGETGNREESASAPPSPGPAGGQVAQIVTALPAADSSSLYLTLIVAGGLAVVLSRLLGRLAVVPSRRRSRS